MGVDWDMWAPQVDRTSIVLREREILIVDEVWTRDMPSSPPGGQDSVVLKRKGKEIREGKPSQSLNERERNGDKSPKKKY